MKQLDLMHINCQRCGTLIWCTDKSKAETTGMCVDCFSENKSRDEQVISATFSKPDLSTSKDNKSRMKNTKETIKKGLAIIEANRKLLEDNKLEWENVYPFNTFRGTTKKEIIDAVGNIVSQELLRQREEIKRIIADDDEGYINEMIRHARNRIKKSLTDKMSTLRS